MSGEIHAYDIELHSRNFLNCAQRHGVVMLAERGAPVDMLFFDALVPTDTMLDQLVRRQIPKYDFASPAMSAKNLARIGVTRTEHFVETYREARPLLLEAIARDGFVLLAGDVFYFPHCPEFRNKHLFHLVILRRLDEARGVWEMIDDNGASVLAHYAYDEASVAAFFENNSVREFRTFAYAPRPGDAIAQETRAAAAEHMADYQDSLVVLREIEAILTTPWFAPERAAGLLAEVAAVLCGSRRLLARHLEAVGAPAELSARASGIATDAARLRDALVRMQITGLSSLARIVARAAAIAQAERALAHDYAAFLAGPAPALARRA